MSNGVFNFNFLVLLLSEILEGSQIYTRGSTSPGRPLLENFFTQSEYFTISNINICGFIGRGKFLYETRVLDNSYLQFKFQLPTSDSTQITAGGPKVPIEGFVPLDAP